MASCEQYQAQLLGYLYDLPEAEERDALREHLVQCASCQAALAGVERQKRILAAAAKAAFPAVRFQPPPAGEVIGSEKTPAGRVLFPKRLWLGAAVAAGILLLLGGGVPATIWSWHFRVTERYAQALTAEYQAKTALAIRLGDERSKALERKRQNVLQVQDKIRKLAESRQPKDEKLPQAAATRPLNVVLSGPQTIQPGAPSSYEVATLNEYNQLVPSPLDVRVVDGNQVLFQRNYANFTGEQRIKLPANLPVTAKSNLLMEVVANQDGGRQEQVRQELALAAPVYITRLTTDKPSYHPGEAVYFRSLTLERFSLKPAQEDFQLVYTLTKPTGEERAVLSGSSLLLDAKTHSPLLGPDKKPIRGIGAGEFVLDPAASGGEYTLRVRETNNRFEAQQHKFFVNPRENLRLNAKLDFARTSYGPGDNVVAECKITRAGDGGRVADQPVIATIHVDGKPYGPDGKGGAKPLVLHTDKNGTVNFHFRLPEKIEAGLASLSVQLKDGAGSESLVRSIPIVVKKLRIDFYPEGGELIAGVPNRVYFQARTLLGRPAELTGRLIDQDDQVVVTKVETLHDDQEPGLNQGMGLFTFTPRMGRKYELRIDTPGGIEGKHELSPMKEDGVALSIPKSVTGPSEPIHVVAWSPHRERTLLFGAYCRGRVMDHRTVLARKGEATSIDLHPVQEMGGVYRITVFEEPRLGARQLAQGIPAEGRQQLLPLAERLVYRKPAKQLHLALKPDKKEYRAGDQVKLSITARNEKEQPAPAVLLVGVVDKSAATTADANAFLSMPTYYYLTTELRRPEDLEYADVLFGSQPKAAAALDLLLGTQGWRRFAEQNPDKSRQQRQEDAERLLVTIGQPSPKSPALGQVQAQGKPPLGTDLVKLQEQEVKAHAELAQSDQQLTAKMDALRIELADLQARQSAAVSRVEAQRALLDKIRAVLLPALAVLFAAIVTILVVFAFWRGLPRGLPAYALAGVCSLLVVGVVLLLREMEPGNAMSAAEAKLAPLPELREQLAAAGGGRAEEALKPSEPQMDHSLPFNAKKPKEGKDGLLGQLARSKGLGKGQAEVKAGLKATVAASGTRDAKDMTKNLGDSFGYKADNAKDVADSKKAVSNLGLKREAAKAGLAKDRERERLQYRNLQKAEGKPALLPKQMAQQKYFANPLGTMPQTKVLGLNSGFRGGFGGAGPAGKPGTEQAGGLGCLGGVPSGPTNGLTDQLYGTNAARLASQAQRLAPPPPPQSLLVREYAYLRPAGDTLQTHADSVATVYWHPVLVLPNGKAEVSFNLCDAAASYQIIAAAHTLDGRLGAVTRTLEPRLR